MAYTLKNLKLKIENKNDIYEALYVLNIFLSHITLCDYGKLGFMDKEHPDREHITIDVRLDNKKEDYGLNLWLNSAGFNEDTNRQIMVIKSFCDKQNLNISEMSYDFGCLKNLVEELEKEIKKDS